MALAWAAACWACEDPNATEGLGVDASGTDAAGTDAAGTDAALPDAAMEPPGRLRWTLAWDLTGLEPVEGAPGFSVVTNLGYQVHLRDGTVTTWDASLLPCDGPKNHGPDTNETSADVAVVESLHAPLPALPWSVREGLVGDYCQGHLVVARADRNSLSDGRALVRDRISLHLELQVTSNSDATWVREVSLDAAFSYGAVLPLPVGLAPLSFTERSIDLRLTRFARTLFDDIDLTGSTDENLGRDVLRNLVLDSRLTVD